MTDINEITRAAQAQLEAWRTGAANVPFVIFGEVEWGDDEPTSLMILTTHIPDEPVSYCCVIPPTPEGMYAEAITTRAFATFIEDEGGCLDSDELEEIHCLRGRAIGLYHWARQLGGHTHYTDHQNMTNHKE